MLPISVLHTTANAHLLSDDPDELLSFFGEIMII